MNIATLHNLFLESSGACTDTRKLKTNDLFFALKGENFDGNLYAEKAIKNGACYAIVDDQKIANKNKKALYVNDVLKALQELATYHRTFLNIPIIAITGSNGKTTTKELVAAVLSKKFNLKATKGNLNNHIGVPLTLLEMDSSTEIGIVEMGANHLKEIEHLCQIAQPDYGYITNFGKAHLEGFGGFEGVIKGKSELYQFLIANKKEIFVNADDEIQLEKSKNAKNISFSEGNQADYQITFLSADPNVKIATSNFNIESNLIGDYNSKNIAIAVCMGLYFKVNPTAIKEAIENYTPSNNRSQIIHKTNYKIILDAYNANPTSMKAALENLKQLPDDKKMVILGDMFEIGNTSFQEHQNIVNQLENFKFDQMYVCGENFYKTKTNQVLKYENFESLKKAIEKINLKNATILIKGSRGMALERILEVL